VAAGKKLVIRYAPVGLVGVIGPWNYPIANSFGDCIPAMMAGNAVILKPSEVTPLSSLLMEEMMRECGLPEGVFQVATGDGSTGAALIEQVDCVMFTGSTKTGKAVMTAAADRLSAVLAFVVSVRRLAHVEHEVRRKVDLNTVIELDESRVTVMDNAGHCRLSIGIPIFGSIGRVQRHGIGSTVVHFAENHGAVARKADVPESKFVRFHVPASILQRPRSPALCGVLGRSSRRPSQG